MSKSVIGYMIRSDYMLYDEYFSRDGVTHADIFREKPMENYPLKTIKVKVTIENLEED